MSSHNLQRYILLFICFLLVSVVSGYIAYLFLPIFFAIVIGLLIGSISIVLLIEFAESV
jgi:hypothetical protein